MHLLVRNTVDDFSVWKRVFDEDQERARSFGLKVEHVWQSADDPREAFFMLSMETRDAAERFMADPRSAEAGERAGVVDGEVWFLK